MKRIKVIMGSILIMLLLITCVSTGPHKGPASIVGVWQGKMWGEEDPMEIIVEFQTGNTVRVLIFGMILKGSYRYDDTVRTLDMEIISFSSLGSSVQIPGTPFADGDEVLSLKDVLVEGNTLSVITMDGDQEPSVFHRIDKFPTRAKDINATVIKVNITNAGNIADKYVLIFAMEAGSMGSDNDQGPISLALGKIASNGTAKINLLIAEDSFHGGNNLELIILGGDIDPENMELGGQGLPFHTVGCFAHWQGRGKPDAFMLSKGRDLSVEMNMIHAFDPATMED